MSDLLSYYNAKAALRRAGWEWLSVFLESDPIARCRELNIRIPKIDG